MRNTRVTHAHNPHLSLSTFSQLDFIRAQLALSVENLEGLRSTAHNPDVDSADRRLQDIFQMARETRARLAEEVG